MKIKIPIKFIGLNKVIGRSKKHWAEYAKLKKQYNDAIVAIVQAEKIMPIAKRKYPVTVKMIWYEPTKRRDPDNIASAKKFVLDGLIKAGVLAGDSWRYVKSFGDKFVKEPDNVGVEVVIK